MRDAHRKSRLDYLIKTDYKSRPIFLEKNPWVSKARLSQVLGKSEPFAEDAAITWEKNLNLPAGWLNNTWPTPMEAKKHGWSASKPYPDSTAESDFTGVYRADVKFSNGTGYVEYHEDEKPPLMFRRDFLGKLGIAPGNAIVVDADGHSNEPKIWAGSVVLVDRGDKAVLNGDFFAFRHEDKLLIKRLNDLRGIGILATAENPDFKPKTVIYQLDEITPETFEVIGKAVWTGVMLK